MASNQWSPPYRHNSDDFARPKPVVPEETLKSDTVQVERKTFVFTLKENARGRFLRITEDVRGRKDTIIIPAPGLEEFKRLLASMQAASDEVPIKVASAEEETET